MSRIDMKNLLIVLWIGATINEVECLMCVRCSSLFQRQCISGHLAPSNCSITTKYCTKYVGTVKLTGDKFVSRDCSDEMEKPGCRETVIHDKEVKICYSACQTDGCNTGSFSSSNYLIVYVISALCLAYNSL